METEKTAPMTFKKLLSIFTLLALSGFISACQTEEQTQAPPPKPIYDSERAAKFLTQRVQTQDVEATPLPLNSDYIQLSVQADASSKTQADFLNNIASPGSQMAVLLGHLSNGDDLKLPSVPLAIYHKEAIGWTRIFQGNGPLTPLFVPQRAPLQVSLEMVLLKDELDELPDDAQKLMTSYTHAFPLLSKENAHEVSSLADAFLQRIALVEEQSFKQFHDFSLSYLENLGVRLETINATADQTYGLNFSVQGRISVLPVQPGTPASYVELLTQPLAGTTTRDALGDLESVFWSVPTEGLRAGCQAIAGALRERMGLSEKDSALILWHMLQPHAIFAQGVDYNIYCTGENLNARLTELGYALPPLKAPRAGAKAVGQQNRILTTLAKQLKSFKDSSYGTIEALMNDSVVIRDEARLLSIYESTKLVDSGNDMIAPAFDRTNATEFVSMLPVQSFGCYTRGTGQRGNQRATLVKLENDPGLWLLNFAFNAKNKINGIQLRSATQKDFCRAIGGRRGANRCVFSGKNFPGLQADRCG